MQPSSIKGLVAGIQSICAAWIHPPSACSGTHLSVFCLMALRKRNLKAMIRLPFTLTLLKKLITYLRGGCFGQYTDLLLETVFLTAFYGFLRGGKFTTRTGSFDPSHDLTIADVSINPHHFSYYSSIQRLMGIGRILSHNFRI